MTDEKLIEEVAARLCLELYGLPLFEAKGSRKLESKVNDLYGVAERVIKACNLTTLRAHDATSIEQVQNRDTLNLSTLETAELEKRVGELRVRMLNVTSHSFICGGYPMTADGETQFFPRNKTEEAVEPLFTFLADFFTAFCASEQKWWELEEALQGKERCEGGCDAPVVMHDSEGIPLCQECWDELVSHSHPASTHPTSGGGR